MRNKPLPGFCSPIKSKDPDLKLDKFKLQTKKSKPNISSFAEIIKGGETTKEGVSGLASIKLNYPYSSGSIYTQGSFMGKYGTKGRGSSENIKAIELGYETKKGNKLGVEFGKLTGAEVDPYVGKIKYKSPVIPKIKLSFQI